jgi:hypothetical protein
VSYGWSRVLLLKTEAPREHAARFCQWGPIPWHRGTFFWCALSVLSPLVVRVFTSGVVSANLGVVSANLPVQAPGPPKLNISKIKKLRFKLNLN